MAYSAQGSGEGSTRSFSRRAMLTAAGWLGTAAALFADKPSIARAAPASAQAEPLEGSWRADVAREGEPPTVSLTTYIPGGNLITTTNDPLLGPGHGVWVRVGEREYDISLVRPRYDSSRSYLGTRSVQGRLRVADSLDVQTGALVATDIDVAGNIVATREIRLQATRIKIEPMS